MKSKPINKLLSFSELHYQRFLKIMELNGIKTYSNCLAFLIDSAYNNIKQTPNDECLKNIQDNIEKLLTIAKENNSMIYQERDGINTLLHFYEVQEYQSADKRLTDSKPHDVLNKSAENYQQLVHRRSLDKGVSALQDQGNEENDTE